MKINELIKYVIVIVVSILIGVPWTFGFLYLLEIFGINILR